MRTLDLGTVLVVGFLHLHTVAGFKQWLLFSVLQILTDSRQFQVGRY